MSIALVLILLFGGGTSYVAEGAVPGDALYSVKTGINESIKSAFVVGAEANAHWEARLVERRLAEGARLEAEGELSVEVEEELAVEVEKHADKSQEYIARLEADGKSEQADVAKVRLAQALAVHTAMQSGEMSDNASEQALQVRNKESAISNVVNKLELKLGAPTLINIDSKADGVDTSSLSESSIVNTAESKATGETVVKPVPASTNSDGSTSESGTKVEVKTEVQVKQDGTVVGATENSLTGKGN